MLSVAVNHAFAASPSADEARIAAPAMQSAFADAGFDSRAYVSPVAGPRADVIG